MKPVNLEIAAQVQPYFYYKRLTLTHYREYFIFKIDNSYGYFLRAISTGWPAINAHGYSPDLNLEFFNKSQLKARQLEPVPAILLSTPSGLGTKPALLPASVPANIRGSRKILNFFYPYGDTVEIHITGQDTTNPEYIDLVLEGYYVPDKSLLYWGS